MLKNYRWPGNVRELKNVIERAVILSGGKILRLDLAMADLLRFVDEPSPDQAEAGEQIYTEEQMVQLQRANIAKALDACDWRVSGPKGAAQLLGLKPTTLADRMKKFKLTRPGVSRNAS